MEMALEHLFRALQQGFERIGIRGGLGHLHLRAKLEPHYLHERGADGPFEFAGRIDYEAAIGRGNEAGDSVADGLGEFFPARAGGEPRWQVGGALGRLFSGSRLTGSAWFCFACAAWARISCRSGTPCLTDFRSASRTAGRVRVRLNLAGQQVVSGTECQNLPDGSSSPSL